MYGAAESALVEAYHISHGPGNSFNPSEEEEEEEESEEEVSYDDTDDEFN